MEFDGDVLIYFSNIARIGTNFPNNYIYEYVLNRLDIRSTGSLR